MSADSFITTTEPRECMICGGVSEYIHLDFEAPMHPGCEWIAWEQYIAADTGVAIASGDGIAMFL